MRHLKRLINAAKKFFTFKDREIRVGDLVMSEKIKEGDDHCSELNNDVLIVDALYSSGTSAIVHRRHGGYSPRFTIPLKGLKRIRFFSSIILGER